MMRSEMKIVLMAVAVDVGWVGRRFNDIFHCFTWIPDWWLWLFVEYFHIYLAIMNYSFLCYWKVILKAFVIQLCHTDPRDTFRGLNGQSAVRWPAPSPRHPPPQTWSWTRVDTIWGHITLHWHCTYTETCSKKVLHAAYEQTFVFQFLWFLCKYYTLYYTVWSKNNHWINIIYNPQCQKQFQLRWWLYNAVKRKSDIWN